MPLDLSQSGTTPNIEAEVDAASLSVVDLVEVDLGLGFNKFWSTTNVDFEFVSSIFPSKFEARIESIGDRTWLLGADNDSITLILGDADGAITKIAQEFGLDVFEGAKVKLHRLFPAIREVYKDYWVGTGEPISIEEDVIEWPITFGIASLKRKFGRLIEFNCPHIFAGGPESDCPYNLSNGIGKPERKLSPVATGGTKDTEIHVSGGGLGSASVGWIVYSRDSNIYAVITEVVSDFLLRIRVVATGEGGNSFSSGDNLIIGPPLTSCVAKNPASCKERGMFGPHGGNSLGSGDKRRYYGGDLESASVLYSGEVPGTRGRFGTGGDRWSRTALGNDNVTGTVIPVILGYYRIRSIPSIYHAPAGRFQHGFFIIGEGEMVDVAVLNINGFLVDTNRAKDFATLNLVIKNDSFMKWGTWTPLGVDDSRATTVNIAKQVRQAIGRRKSVGVMSGNSIIDTYGNGGVFGHPYLFNTGAGDGTSQHGLVTVRARIDTEQDTETSLTGDFDIHGLLVPLPPGMSNNEEDRSTYNIVVGSTTLRYTAQPNPIQVAYALLRSNRWGAGLTDNQIDLAAVITESNYCEERLEGVESAAIRVIGTVDTSSFQATGSPQNTWIFATDIANFDNALLGRTVTFNKTNDKKFTAIIAANSFYEVFQPRDLVDADPGVLRAEDAAAVDPTGNLITIDRPFPSGKEPVNGDGVEVHGGFFNHRFKANGVLADHVSIPDMLQSVLDNCNGTFRSNGDKIEFLIRKELSPAEINTIISDGIFTDRGVNRNILNSDGKSTIRVWRDRETEIGNYFSVSFRDRERNFQESKVTVTNDAAQRRASKLFGDLGGREKLESNEQLILTTTKDQAARLLALKARELFIQNLFCEFETSLKRGMKARPGDIIAIDSNRIANLFSKISEDVVIGTTFLFRVLEKVETGSYTIRFRCKIHVNPIYSDFATDFAQFFGPDITRRERNVSVASVTPLTPAELTIAGQDGTYSTSLKVKVTYPSLEET